MLCRLECYICAFIVRSLKSIYACKVALKFHGIALCSVSICNFSNAFNIYTIDNFYWIVAFCFQSFKRVIRLFHNAAIVPGGHVAGRQCKIFYFSICIVILTTKPNGFNYRTRGMLPCFVCYNNCLCAVCVCNFNLGNKHHRAPNFRGTIVTCAVRRGIIVEPFTHVNTNCIFALY